MIRDRVDNLLDGLVSQGLAPDGTDPGMKGVTRYVRLPEGYNTKANNVDVNGNPFKCQMVEWEPCRKVSMEQLADAFDIDLDRVRGGAAGTMINLKYLTSKAGSKRPLTRLASITSPVHGSTSIQVKLTTVQSFISGRTVLLASIVSTGTALRRDGQNLRCSWVKCLSMLTI